MHIIVLFIDELVKCISKKVDLLTQLNFTILAYKVRFVLLYTIIWAYF